MLKEAVEGGRRTVATVVTGDKAVKGEEDKGRDRTGMCVVW